MSRFPKAAAAEWTVLAVLVFPVGLVACGSGGGDPAGTGSRAQFIREANLICNEANEVLREATAEWFGPDLKLDEETGIRFTHEVWVPNLREQIRSLRGLETPPADRMRIGAMLDGLDRATDRVEADPSLASKGPFDRVTRRLTAYGIGPCGSP